MRPDNERSITKYIVDNLGSEALQEISGATRSFNMGVEGAVANLIEKGEIEKAQQLIAAARLFSDRMVARGLSANKTNPEMMKDVLEAAALALAPEATEGNRVEKIVTLLHRRYGIRGTNNPSFGSSFFARLRRGPRGQ